MAAARRDAQAYRAALVKCFFGSGSRAQASVRRTDARKRRNASFATQSIGRARLRAARVPAPAAEAKFS